MKQIEKTIICFVLAGLIGSIGACKELPNEAGTQRNETALDVWSVQSTVKIKQEERYPEKDKKELSYTISGGRGEFEASQVIITAASDKRVDSYDIEVSDLTCGENVIDESYIQVYNEKYIEVSTTPNTYSTGLGWYPDALLPFEKAVEYGENTVEAGKNQGLYIETFIPRNIPAGIYTGSFTLTVDGETFPVPASVQVYDFEVSQESHLEVDWITNSLWGFGELDNTRETKYNYFKALVEYRASNNSFQSGHKDMEEWLENVRIYTNPNLRDENGQPLIAETESYLAAINIYVPYHSSQGISFSGFDEYIANLLKISIQDNYNYLAKVGSYLGYIDEPHYNNNWDQVKFVCEGFEDRKVYWSNLIADLDLQAINKNKISGGGITQEMIDGVSQEFLSELQNSMLLVGNYVTTSPNNKLDSSATRQFCISSSAIMNASDLEELRNWTDKDISGNWWYAVGESPFGYMIDSSPLVQRLSQWYTYDIGAEGYLVWETAKYTETVWDSQLNANINNTCDAYEVALRVANGNGEGFLFYPGEAYGIEGPVASIRAKQYRDSHEEYEYFYLLNALYQDAGYSIDGVLKRIFANLYNGYYVTEDADFFDLQRKTLINLVLLAQKGVFITEFSQVSEKVTMKVNATQDEKLVNKCGEAISATDAIEITVDMTKANEKLSFATQSGLGIELYLGGVAKKIISAETQATVRGGSCESAQLNGEQAAKFTFTVDTEIHQDDRNFDFTYEADKTLINQESGSLMVGVYNPSDERILLECWFLGSGGRTVFVDDVILTQGYNTFYIPRLDTAKWSLIRKLEGVRFKVSMPNEEGCTIYFTGAYTVQ